MNVYAVADSRFRAPSRSILSRSVPGQEPFASRNFYRERCFFDNQSWRGSRQQIVLADDALAVLHQVDQQVENLRLHGDRLVAAMQLPPVGIKRMIGKEELHGAVTAPTLPR